jgi:hypothetical protein
MAMDEIDEIEALHRARAAAKECERAAGQFADFAQRLTPVVGAAELAEYDALVAREAIALSERVDAFAQLGFGVASLEGELDGSALDGTALDSADLDSAGRGSSEAGQTEGDG